ncbi:glycosyltransferase family 4 protein [Sphingobacterium paramultivorum]|uniref:Glycosyltransferase family 4 protein n=1 Tax=Sphingobacterium paramultivorum TaxID=2886510 RepID=A0A7G5E702_9SPHI|nr:glycosyltransferase family 4 protein [Sphingobacterium paramultivorum]QMV69777.1 glycosyltransferase family 4 protein [Sphingobacterium paramultivorum]WSO13602.1 glycosyltransferase family 4 protein [Sphingobacterium paramultivorum]
MKILFFLSSLKNKGGVESATVALINSLAESSSHEIYLLTLNDKVDDFAFAVRPNITVLNLNILSYKREYFSMIFRFRKLIKKMKIDVVISVEAISLLFSFLPMLGIQKNTKLVVWEHFNFKNNNGRKSREFFRKLAARYADMIVTLTERDVMMWREHLKMKAPITFIYNISSYENINNPYSVKSRKAIAIGRYVPVKGFERLIRIWSNMSRKYDIKDWELQIVGYGDLESTYSELIHSENCTSIILKNGAAGTQQFLLNAGIYCMTSFFEGLPMVLIEAQNFGLPCISFDIYSGPSEILTENSGVLIADGNMEEYTDKLFELISNEELRSEMSDSAYVLSQRFKPKEILESWENIFEKIVQ